MEIHNSSQKYLKNDIKGDHSVKPKYSHTESSTSSLKADKLDIKTFKLFTDKHTIKVSDDIKVPKLLKKLWTEVIKDGVLTMGDYEKITKLSNDLKINNTTEFQEFIKTIEDKLLVNKGVISFIENNSEISMKELSDLLE